MPEVGLHREFLHRSCVQLSASLADTTAADVERQHALRFVRLHAGEHVSEVARALVWRVVDTDDDSVADRAGAWALLTAVLLECGDSNNDLSRTALAGKLLLFLPYLIAHRWYTRVVATTTTTTLSSSSYATGAGAAAAAAHSDNDDEEAADHAARNADTGDKEGAAPHHRRRPRIHLDTSGFGKVVPASLINGSSSSGGRHGGLSQGDGYVAQAYTRLYRGLFASWKAVWRSDVYQSLKEVVRGVERQGRQPLSGKAAEYLAIPATFRDSLWRLRRRTPRPSIALHMLYCYGWVPQTLPCNNNNLLRPRTLVLPSSLSDVRALDAAMHPGALSWMRKLVECKGGCRLCDTWHHTEARCPCELPFVRSPSDEAEVRRQQRRYGEASGGGGNAAAAAIVLSAAAMSSSSALLLARGSSSTPLLLLSPACDAGGALSTLTAVMAGTTAATAGGAAAAAVAVSSSAALSSSYTFLDAVEKLHRHGLHLPLRVAAAYDRVTSLIQAEQPYEELLAAIDVVRGAVTGPRERHALWLHASYRLLPSATVFDKPSDDALSPTLTRAEAHFTTHRRYREWDALLQGVEALDTPLRRRVLPAALRRCVEEVRETNSFFFCLVDGSLPSSYTPGRYARVPEEVVALAAYKDVLCRVCLEPFHTAAHCPQLTSARGSGGGALGAEAPTDAATARAARNNTTGVVYVEPWDLHVARLVLEDNHLTTLRYHDEATKLDEALRRIDADDRQAKAFRQCELSLAVRLVHARRLPLCTTCRVVGHSLRGCEVHARRVLAREELHPVDVCLTPSLLHERVARLRQRQREAEARELQAAFALLYRGVRRYPASYAVAMRELADACVPLAAARYSTDAVQGFLLFINSSDLLTHLLPLRDAAFPEVCLFCDSCHHLGEDCRHARDEEQGFLRELRACGVDLWSYVHTPDYYDERLPTDYVQGKESVLRLVRQFVEDYGPGGVARRKFIEHNGLDHTAAATQGGGFAVLGGGDAVGASSSPVRGGSSGSGGGATTAAAAHGDDADGGGGGGNDATHASSAHASHHYNNSHSNGAAAVVVASSSSTTTTHVPMRASPYGVRFSQLVAPPPPPPQQDAAHASSNSNNNTQHDIVDVDVDMLHRYASADAQSVRDDAGDNDNGGAMTQPPAAATHMALSHDEVRASGHKRARGDGDVDDADKNSDDAARVAEGGKLHSFLLAGMLTRTHDDTKDKEHDDVTVTAAAADAAAAATAAHESYVDDDDDDTLPSSAKSARVAAPVVVRNGHAPRTLRLFASSAHGSGGSGAAARAGHDDTTMAGSNNSSNNSDDAAATATTTAPAAVAAQTHTSSSSQQHDEQHEQQQHNNKDAAAVHDVVVA